MLLQPWQIALIVIGSILIIAAILILIILCKPPATTTTSYYFYYYKDNYYNQYRCRSVQAKVLLLHVFRMRLAQLLLFQ